MLQKWSWDGHTLATCAQSVFFLELILLTIHILCSVALGAMECVLGGNLIRTFMKSTSDTGLCLHHLCPNGGSDHWNLQ